MIKLDSIKVEIPTSCIEDISNSHNWQKIEQTDNCGNINKQIKYLNKLAIGIKRLEINQQTDNAIIELSAKALGSNYHTGISINSISELIDNINNTGIISLNLNKTIEQSKLLKADVTDNLRVKDDVTKYLNNLYATTKTNYAYNVTQYNVKGNRGIVIQGKQRSYKERVIMYDKFTELQRDKDINKIYKFNQLEQKFKNTLRVEMNLTQLRKIREYAETPTTNLLEVLTSSASPNHKLLMKVTKGTEQIPLFDLNQFKSIAEFEKRKGQESILQFCNYDINIVRNLLQEFGTTGRQVTKKVKQYKELLQLMEIDKEPDHNKYINEIMEMLKVA
jgi:hypothetical protein